MAFGGPGKYFYKAGSPKLCSFIAIFYQAYKIIYLCRAYVNHMTANLFNGSRKTSVIMMLYPEQPVHYGQQHAQDRTKQQRISGALTPY